MADCSSADVIIVDGEDLVTRFPAQIVLRITAALPGDETYGHLKADCSEDLLNALVGFFTNMGTSSRFLGRPVIYTPLPLCSVYAGVNGAIAVGAALTDRERCGLGREIVASRLAGGLSAIGALTLTSSGIPEHLAPATVGGLPEGLTVEAFKSIADEASQNSAKQLWLEQRFAPLAAPFRAADDRMVLPLAAPNRRLTQKLLDLMGIREEALAAGMEDLSPYDPANTGYSGRNLADSMALNFHMTSKLADLLEAAFAKKTSSEWEQILNSAGVPLAVVQSWQEWQNDPKARAAGIFAKVQGHEAVQIGRAAWVASAQPYPDLEACHHTDSVPARTASWPLANSSAPASLPLEGFIVVDFCNVVAGPNCGRMFVELGATVYKIDPINPQHSPTIMVTWSAESGVGKRSIILDMHNEEGRVIMNKIVAKADMIVANKLDHQLARLGLDPESLAKLNPSAIGIQITAHRGEKRGPRHDFPGYDPALQGTTGIMDRFGPEGCPTYHGVASCVDYLCGYLGVWAGVTALQARERRKDGHGDWAETSLATAASLTQLLLQQTREPASARGPYATGNNAGERVYSLADGWIFAQGQHDLTTELDSRTVKDALAYLNGKGINAVPVQTCEELAARHRDQPSKTVKFERREKDGWENECFAPTWFAFDGEPAPRPNATSRIGSDAPAILAELGYDAKEVERLRSINAVGHTEWFEH
jgi:crotonobetainyl-CoA:carnitine CoA-transferase CaiB-like acyl-CoA transferase